MYGIHWHGQGFSSSTAQWSPGQIPPTACSLTPRARAATGHDDSLPELPGVALRSDECGRVHRDGYVVEERWFNIRLCQDPRVRAQWTHWTSCHYRLRRRRSERFPKQSTRLAPACSRRYGRQRLKACRNCSCSWAMTCPGTEQMANLAPRRWKRSKRFRRMKVWKWTASMAKRATLR